MLLATLAASLAACSPFRVVNQLSPSDHFDREADIAYGESDRQRLDIYTSRLAGERSPVVVFFYGGGWRNGSRENYEFVASSLTEAGYTVIIPDYRLFPDVVFPAFVEDGARVVAWALENARDYGADPDTLFLMGHSAGAHIAALLSLDAHYLGEHGIGTDRIRGLIGLSGPYDFLPIESGYLLDVFPADRREASQPINFVTPEAPPTLLIHGANDNIVKSANSERLAERLTQQGVNATVKLYEGTGHARTAAALAPVLDFVGETLADSRQFLDTLSSPAAD